MQHQPPRLRLDDAEADAQVVRDSLHDVHETELAGLVDDAKVSGLVRQNAPVLRHFAVLVDRQRRLAREHRLEHFHAIQGSAEVLFVSVEPDVRGVFV
jgi:hypothetical protein